MILGIGIDLVEIARVEGIVERRGARALRRLFTIGEVERCGRSRAPSESFAARFAAKEAFFKATGRGWGQGIAWTEIEVCSAPTGAPHLRLTGEAERIAAKIGVRHIHLSLTHTDTMAGAYLILEG
jgi:holo-[acyl-carrier protein] synthase